MPRLKCKVSFVSLPKKLLKDYGLHTLDALPFFLSVKMVFNFNCFATNLENQGQTESYFGTAFELDDYNTCTVHTCTVKEFSIIPSSKTF